MFDWCGEQECTRKDGFAGIAWVVVLAVAAGIPVQTAWATSIGVTWINNSTPGRVDGDTESLLPTEVAGVPGFEQAHWNNFGRYSSTSSSIQLFGLPLSDTGDHIYDSTGAATGLQMAWSASGSYFTSSIGASTPNRKLMTAYLDSNGKSAVATTTYDFSKADNLPGLYVSGLSGWLAAQSADSYAIIIYSDGGAAVGRAAEFWIQSATPASPWDPANIALGSELTGHVFLDDLADFTDTFTWVPYAANSSTARAKGNYVAFTGLTADQIILRVDDNYPPDYGTSSRRSPLNAVQIVAYSFTASLPTVSIAKNGDAAEPSTGNTFTVTRTGSTAAALAVKYEMSGTATNGVDYQALSGSVTIPAGSASATITVTPIDDKIVETTPETIIATVPPSRTYLADAVNCVATMNLVEDDVRSTTSIGVSFTGHASTREDVYSAIRPWEVVGASDFKRPNWGNYGRDSGATPALVYPKEDTGAASTQVQVAWKATGGVGVNDYRVDPNAKLLRGYLDSNGAVNVAGGAGTNYVMTDNSNLPGVYVTGLSAWLAAQGADSYNVLVYSDGAYTGGRIAEYWVQAAPDTFAAGGMTLGAELTAHVFIKDVLDFGQTDVASFLYVPPASNSAAAAVSGNYTVFTGLAANSIILRSEDTYQPPGDVGRCPLSGFQIWPIKNSALMGALTVTATDPAAGEPNNNGQFTITRTGSAAEALTVAYVLGGTATVGADYAALPASVTIPAGQSSVTLPVTVIEDSIVETSPETVTLSLVPRTDYTVNEAMVNITDDEVAATITSTAADATATETPGNTGAVTITRTGSPTTYPLTIDLTLGGAAANGIDYAKIPAQVVIPAGQASVTVNVTPIEDGVTEGPESVLVIVNNSATGQYIVVGPPAEVAIADNGSWSHWTRSKTLAFGGYTGTTPLVDFPVLVVLTPENTFNYRGFAPGGADLRFLDLDDAGTAYLSHEIEQWDASGTSLIWVKVPLIDSPSDGIRMLSGCPGAVNASYSPGVWTNGYLGVYHFAGTTGVPDATGAHDGADHNTTSVAGYLGKGRGFNGTNAYIDLGGKIMDNLGAFSMSGWVNAAAFGDRQSLFGEKLIFEFGFNGAGGLGFYTSFDNGVPGYAYGDKINQWHYITVTGDVVTAGYIRILVDGEQVSDKASNNSGGFGAGSENTRIGAGVWDRIADVPATGWFNGAMDEVRFGSTLHSNDWVANEYKSMTNTLVTYCGQVRVDLDGDGDVDQEDFGLLQSCFAGPDHPVSGVCGCADTTGDGWITAADVEDFVRCVSGPNIPVNPNCLTPQ